MNILLTGSDEHSSHLFYHLKEEHNVIGFDIKHAHDILKTEFPKDIDLVIHLAGLSGVRDSLERPTEYWKTNVIGTQRLFEHFRETRIIYASSSTAHGMENPYAMSKYGMEQLDHNNSVGMRFTTVYGLRCKKRNVNTKNFKCDVQYLNVNHIRDFIHVNDIVNAVQIMMDNSFRGVVDVGTGISNKLVDIADYFKIDYKSVIGDETERLDNTLDTSILNKFGWRAKINLYNYIEENRNVN